MKLIRLLSCLAALWLGTAITTMPVFAQSNVTVSKKASENRVRFAGISGSPEFSAQVKSDLKNCGWFELVDGQADFTISGSASTAGISMAVQPAKGIGFSVSESMKGNVRETSHRAVDQILNKLFDIKGICSYKIAFALEVSPTVKHIYTCDFDGSNVQKIVGVNAICTEPEWGPGGQTLLYTLYGKTHTCIAETNIGNKLTRILSQANGMNADPCMSPLGNTYVFLMSKDGNVEVYLRGYGTGTLRCMTGTKGTEGTPNFSQTGNEFCFISDEGSFGRTAIYRMNVNGGSPVRVKSAGSNPTSPNWSYDNKIVYSAVTGQGHSICVTDLSGQTGQGTGIILGGGFESPSWAPDNRHIVCQQVSRGRSQLWVVDTWTGTKRLLFNARSNVSVPAWQKH